MFDSVESWWQKCQAPKNKVQGLPTVNSVYFKAYMPFNIVFEMCAFVLRCGFFRFLCSLFSRKNFNHMQSCFVTPTGSQTLNWTLDVELLTQHRLIELAVGRFAHATLILFLFATWIWIQDFKSFAILHSNVTRHCTEHLKFLKSD